jgi:hypothetical protein
MDGMDVVDRMDVTPQVSLFSVHVIDKAHAGHHFKKRLKY